MDLVIYISTINDDDNINVFRYTQDRGFLMKDESFKIDDPSKFWGNDWIHECEQTLCLGPSIFIKIYQQYLYIWTNSKTKYVFLYNLNGEYLNKKYEMKYSLNSNGNIVPKALITNYLKFNQDLVNRMECIDLNDELSVIASSGRRHFVSECGGTISVEFDWDNAMIIRYDENGKEIGKLKNPRGDRNEFDKDITQLIITEDNDIYFKYSTARLSSQGCENNIWVWKYHKDKIEVLLDIGSEMFIRYMKYL